MKVFNFKACFCILLLLSFGSSRNSALYSDSNISEINDSRSIDSGSGGKGFKLVGQVGGPTQALAVKNNYAYVGIGMRMVVLDVSKPSKIKQVGTTKVLDGFVTGVAVYKSRAYVTAGGAGLYVVNISKPRRPSVIGFYDSPGYPENVCIKGKYAYVADGWAGLQVVDISNSKKPKEVGSLSTIGYAFDAVVANHIAYVAAAGAGLEVVDIKNPKKPVEIGKYNTAGYAFGLALSNKKKIVYVADGWEGVRAIDVSNPYQPQSIGSHKTPGWAFGVAVQGDILFAADAFKGLRVIDVSSPSSSKELGAYEVDGHAGRVVTLGNKAYVADRNNGLRIIDISNTSNLSQIGFYSALGYAREVAVSGNYACVAGGPYGLRMIDVSDPTRPKEVGQYDTKGFANCVSMAGNRAYVATVKSSGEDPPFHIVDISDPKNPTRIGSHYPPYPAGQYIDMVISGGMAYMANEVGLETVDISNPTSPFRTGVIQFWDEATGSATVGVDVSGTISYLGQHQEGIKIVDASDPGNLTLIGSFEDESSFSVDLTVVGEKAYVAEYHIFRVLDVSNPASPTELGRLDTQGQACEVEVAGNIAYVANGSSGVLAVDISNPSSLSLLGEFNTPGCSLKLHKEGNLLYVADADAGLLIFEIKSTTQTKQPSFHSSSSPQIKYPRFGLRHSAYGHLRKTFSMPGKKQIARLTPQKTKKYVVSTTWVVNTTADSGEGSLRLCMKNAQNGDKITFDTSVFPPSNPATITVSSKLPTLNKGNVTIDASSAGVIIDGKNLSDNASGIWIGSNGNVVMGLQILNFPTTGVSISGEENIIGGDRTKGNGPVGQGNVISGNGSSGVSLNGDRNTVLGNLIGVDVSGTQVLGNGYFGVMIRNSKDNTIGGTGPGEENVISGSGNHGVSMAGTEVSGNSIIGNYIGTDVNGRVDLGNVRHGVGIELGSFNNLVKGNLLSGNGSNGVLIGDWGSSYNTVIGNVIGLDSSGKNALGNDRAGVAIGYYGASFNRVGGTSPEERNIISGHPYRDGVYPAGVAIYGPSGTNNFVMGNFIGTDITGTRAIPNNSGISVGGGSNHNFIGGTTEDERNVISGNNVNFALGRSDYNFIAGNYIGINADGTSTLPNKYQGISVGEKTFHNAICGNLIYGNPGIDIYGDDNIVRGNTLTQSTFGLKASGSYNFIYYNKFLNNQTQASDSGKNSWDRDGSGNYWRDYKGSDADGDGIGDTPYKILPNGVDHFPLMNRSSKLTIKILPKKGGKVTRAPKKSRYDFEENVQLRANPSRGYTFSSWSGDFPFMKRKKNPLILTMNTDKSITANFVPNVSSFISVSKRFLNFGAVVKDAKTPTQWFRILNTGIEKLDWYITDNAKWLACSPPSGTGTAIINVSVNPSGLSVGTYTAAIWVSSSLSNFFQTITVTLAIMSSSEAGVPFGEWDKPLESSSSYGGCFPFSGWALDRIGIESVKVYRIKAPTDDPSSPDEIYVGDAFFVEGARPDVEALYLFYPQCNRGGWGYNLVSDILPGDGFYTFIVKARSVSGEEVELGRRKINIDNTYSFNPFGTLDFPKPGGVISGSLYNMLGWGLSKGQSHISEINLYIDSEYKRTLSLGFPRPEIQLILPGYTDSDFPTFIATIDTTSLSNNYHTAFLIAGDSEERQAVLGSRHFYRADVDKMNGLENSEQNRIKEYMGILEGKDYGREAEEKQRKKIEYADEKVEIEVNELKNVAIRNFSEEGEEIVYKALYRGKELLPLGMSFDEKRGIISWLPIPGFKGEFPIDVLKFNKSILIERKRIVFNVE